MSIIRKNPIFLACTLLISYMPSFFAASSVENTAATACEAYGFKGVTQAVKGWQDSSGCDALPGSGAQINQVCSHLVQPPFSPVCGYTFYGDTTVLACKGNEGPEPEDNTYFKYVLCENPLAHFDHRLNWVYLQGLKQDGLGAVIKQPLK